jgi:Protein of unknown function (DUF970)
LSTTRMHPWSFPSLTRRALW